MIININIDSISSSIGAIITLTFAVYYFTSYLIVKKELLYLVIALSMFSFFIYLSGYSLYASANKPDTVLFWTRICYAGGAFIIYSSFLLSSEIIHKTSKTLSRATLVLVIFLMILIFLPVDFIFTQNLNPDKTHSSVLKGPLFPYLLATILLADFLLIIRFVRGLFQNKEEMHLLMPILFGLVFWFLEALFDGVFGAVLGLVNMKLSLGPIIMTFCLALYSGRFAELQNSELIRVKKEKEKIYHNLIYDKLSALYSREYFTEILEHRIVLAQREAVCDCVLFFDVDYFKTVNDELGHSYGDDLIAYLGQNLKQHSRKSDVCARYGGDEFLVLFENCDLENAQKRAKEIQNQFNQGIYEVLGQWEGSKKVSLSIGIVYSASWGLDPQETIRRADLAMYEAKQSGRNAVVAYTIKKS